MVLTRNRVAYFSVTLIFTLGIATAYGFPSVYPTGTTIYNPEKAWNGYTIYPSPEGQGAVLVDMNGNLIRRFEDIPGAPIRILPGGHVMGGSMGVLVQQDWDGNEVWRFDRTEQIEDDDGNLVWSSRQHHDWQREGSPAGYYSPASAPQLNSGRTLILAVKNLIRPEITDKRLRDDYVLEVSWDGEILWDWSPSDHLDELGFSEAALNSIHRNSPWNEGSQSSDWLHFNSLSYVGPNQWYDAGDERFHPDNVIFSSRSANIVAIVARSGEIVWRMGPDYRETEALREIGQVIGQHHPHIIPEGLPGAGNLMVFDNGGGAGYGEPNPAAPNGRNIVERYSSRVLEIDPVTMEKVWEYSIQGHGRFHFFSHNVSMAQRLPNGNTLITEGAAGRAFEVTVDHEIVWEYINPFFYESDDTRHNFYRAYRVPYEWIPQLTPPEERPVVPPSLSDFRIEPQ
jgi:outer membrane protein assembly factor BamB